MKHRAKLMTLFVPPELYQALCEVDSSPSAALLGLAWIGLDTIEMARQRQEMDEIRRAAERRLPPKEGEFNGP